MEFILAIGLVALFSFGLLAGVEPVELDRSDVQALSVI
jgi:hypothetical protein